MKNANEIRLYGKNRKRVAAGKRCYWTDAKGWRADRKTLTGREPVRVNVTSHSAVPEFAGLSPMRIGPVACYRENGKLVKAINLEVAWQYSKVYSEILGDDGKLIDVRARFLTKDAQGKPVPTAEWFAWRDAAYHNPQFDYRHPEFARHKKLVRRAFPKGSQVAGWYWDGELLDAVTARKKIYARLYEQHVKSLPGFQSLRKIVARGEDLLIFDFDGYDWRTLNMSPSDCVRDLNHSFGHGMVLAFLLSGIKPSTLKSN